MAKVDPFVSPLPQKIITDPELRPFFEYLVRFLHDLWKRTGGGEDSIENLEASQTAEDGGNRTNRFVRDELDEIKGSISQFKWPKNYDDDIQCLADLMAEAKRSVRTVEQKIDELTERYDSGT